VIKRENIKALAALDQIKAVKAPAIFGKVELCQGISESGAPGDETLIFYKKANIWLF